MTHTFTLSRSDFTSFQRQVVKVLRKTVPRSWAFLLQMAVWLFIGLAVSTYLRLYDAASEYRRPLAIVGGLTVLAVVVFVLARVAPGRIVQKHLLRDNGSLLSPQTITLDEEGLVVITLEGQGSSRFAWAAFIGRTEDERNVYLFLEPSYGFIIPKTAIAGAGQELVGRKLREL
ncbi:YcxB family protein [Ramlibacter humi]|uniref:YcxB family protein n=1 Tax=Ramlibacter humi TaxID=2530451 RepID=A0A4Z0C7S6_9BURK|nr:YcxB family protein [Ramlibacter humi]TFZ07653.1 YcxB family protein [Ramlibacter humi]